MKRRDIIVLSSLVFLLLSITNGCLFRDDNSGSSAAPKAPSNLTADATLPSRINLSWDDNSTDETGFVIERQKQGQSGFSYLASVNANTTYYADTNLSSETFYYYRVKAFNSGGNSPSSNQAEAQTLPGPPDNPLLLQANTFSFQQIDIRWQDNSFNEEGFRIERKTTVNGTYSVITTVATDVISFSDTSLLPETKYYYRLRAYNFLGDSSNSNELSATTQPMPPTAPSGLTTTANAGVPYQVSLQWTDNSNNETGFKIERKTEGGNFQEITSPISNTTSWIDTAVMPGTTYYYRLYGWNDGGYGGYSDVSTVTTPSWLPLAPDQLEAWAVSSSQINLQWRDNSNNETEFRIERSPNGTGSWTEIATTADNAEIYSNRTLSAGTAYYYRVRAYDSTAGNYSDYSDIASDTTYPPPTYNPAAPSTPVTSTVYGYELTIRFTDQSDNEEGFKIERSPNGVDSWTEITQTGAVSSSGSTVSYTDQTVTATSTYYYRLTAYNSFGNSSPPATSTAITTKGPPPLAPSALSATALSYNEIALEWDDNSGNEQTFKLERKKTGGTYVQILSLLANFTSYDDNNNIQPQNTYYYRIRAFGEGGYSSYSDEASVTTPVGPPSAPVITRLETVSASQINIFWNDESNNETGFKIERKIPGGTFEEITQVAANVTSHADNTLTPNTTYYYRIRAYNLYNSLYSGVLSAITLSLPPNAPSNLTGTAVSPVQVNLLWNDNSNNEDGFAVESRKESEPDYYQIGNPAANNNALSHLSVTETTTYYYRVRAWNSVGMSNYSNAISVTTPSPSSITPLAPSNLTGTAVSSYRINLLWQDNSSNEDGFRIKRQSPGEVQFTEVGTAAANVVSFADTALNDLTAYTYTVLAYNAVGDSSTSNEITATTIAATWISISTTDKPTSRWLHASAYDAEHGQMVLFGGWDSDNRDDTWLYDGTNWVWQYSSNKPPGRRNHALAYDANRKVVILFGGMDLVGKNDTWEWDGADWTEKNPSAKPPAREGHSLTYDAQRQKIVLFGGVISGTYLNDTWEWDGINWVNKNPVNKPSGRTGHAITYDYASQKIILFGGRDSQLKNDMWEWNGANWTQLNPPAKPSARAYCTAVYDTLRQEIVLFGGQESGGYMDDTWEWTGTTWTQKTTANKPLARYWHSIAYDSARRRIIIFGGYNGARLNDTWEYP
ncbi:MAG: fibronectin type III domain-containing protein [Planctomycetes bacterium]|nr:fibronectin type III domain-containing protein [Planctomycetota bacterium]